MIDKYNNPRLHNTVLTGPGMTHPRNPHVVIGSEEKGFIQGDLMDANAVMETIDQKIDVDNLLDEEKLHSAIVNAQEDTARFVHDKIEELTESIVPTEIYDENQWHKVGTWSLPSSLSSDIIVDMPVIQKVVTLTDNPGILHRTSTDGLNRGEFFVAFMDHPEDSTKEMATIVAWCHEMIITAAVYVGEEVHEVVVSSLTDCSTIDLSDYIILLTQDHGISIKWSLRGTYNKLKELYKLSDEEVPEVTFEEPKIVLRELVRSRDKIQQGGLAA